MVTVQTEQGVGITKRRCITKTNLPRLSLAAGVLLVSAALAATLHVGLAKPIDEASSTKEQQPTVQEDPYSLGCYADDLSLRIMPYVFTDDALTPLVCGAHCARGGYFYYALQSGVECWCGHKDTEIDRHGTGICDHPCGGDTNSICGGHLAFTAYTVGANTPSVGEIAPNAMTVCPGDVASINFKSDEVYFEDGGCATLTDMYNAQDDDGPLYTLDDDDNVVDGGGGTPTGRWLLTTNLRVVDNVTLYIHGTDVGGDCDVLRIESTDDDFYEIRGHGGSLSFKNTKVTSWDTDNDSERTSDTDGRSFIRCISEVDSDDSCEGAADDDMGECRMDIIDSTMGNLGFHDSESYGIVWKVRGFCKDKSNPEVFDRTGVYGDIQNSEVYGMYYGLYSYGHDGGMWTGNVVHDNIQYGFDPHDDSDNLVIANNTVYGNGNHGIIASRRCSNIKIYDNEVYDGGDLAVGIFLHRSTDNAFVYDNYVHDMHDAGIAIMESMDATIFNNVIENVRYGIRISVGGAGNSIYGNTFDSCSDAGYFTYEGTDVPDVSDGRPSENVLTGNIFSNTPTGIDLHQTDASAFIDNDFSDADIFMLYDSTETYWIGNTIGNACMKSSSPFAPGSDAIPSC